MALKIADRVWESASAPGTSNVTLGGAQTGYQTFNAGIGVGNTTYYSIFDVSGPNWEVGLGTLSASTTLQRTTVIASSNAGALVNFTGSVSVICTNPAEYSPLIPNVAGTSFSGTNISGTVNSNGVSLSAAAQSVQPMIYSAANGSTSSGTLVFANSNGVSFSTGTQGVYGTVATNYLTTAMQSNASSAFAGTGYTSTTTAGTAIVATHNTAGLSMGVPAYITTALASNAGSNFAGLNSAITGGSMTLNSSGLSINLPAYLTTAMQSASSSAFVQTSASSLFQLTSATSAITSNAFAASATTKFAGTGTTFAGTNVSGSITMNSNGLNLALSAGAGGGGGIGAAISGNTSGALSTITSGTMVLFGGNNITLSQNGQSITLSGANAGGAQTAISGIGAGTQTATSGTVIFSNSNGISFGLSSGTITASYNSTQFDLAANTTNYQFTSNTSAITSNALNTSQSSLFDLTANRSQLQFTSNTSAITSNALNTSASSNFYLTANQSLIQFTSNTSAITSNALNTSVSSNFMLTANASLYQLTSNTSNITSNALNTSVSSNFQLTSNTSNITSNAFAASATTKFAGTGTTFAGTNVSGSITMNSNGINLALSAGAGSGGGSYNIISASGNTTGTLTTFSSGTMVLAGGNNLTLSQSSNTISFNAPNQSYFVAGTNITLSSSSNSISIIGGAGGGGGGIAIADSAGTQTSGTVIFSNSNQVSFGLSAGTLTASIPNFTSASSVFLQTSQSSLFDLTANRSQLQYTSNTSAITASALNTSQSSLFDLAANTTKYAGTGTSATNASITMNSNGLAISVAAGGAQTISDWNPYQLAASSTTSFAQNTLHFMQVLPQNYVAVSAIEMLWSFSHSSTSNVAWTNARTLSYGLYAENSGGGATAFSLLGSSSFALILSASSNLSMGITMSQGTNSQTYSTNASAITAFNQAQWKIMSLPFATTLTPSIAPYYFGYVMSTATTGANVNVTHQYIMNNEQSNASNGAWAVTGFTASNQSLIQEPYGFIYSATTGGLGASYAYSNMSINSNTQPYVYFEA